MNIKTIALGSALVTSLAGNMALIGTNIVKRENIRENIQRIIPDQDPEVLDALPSHMGAWLGCEKANADLDQGNGKVTMSELRCFWLVKDRVESQWLTHEQEIKARGAIKIP